MVVISLITLDIHFEYWTEHVTFGLLYVMQRFSTRIFTGEFQALQLIVLVMFGAVDQQLASCMLVHFLQI